MADSPLNLQQPKVARCPQCGEFIDAASLTCRFCKAPLAADAMRIAAASHTAATRRQSQLNDRRALLYGIYSLIVTLIAAVVIFGRRFFRQYSRTSR